ncbi:MAG: tetratricopeptide (TPR) repeat protein, partial [Myxococcota bacterium]
PLLDRFLVTNTDASTAKYFRAECLLKLGRFAEAQAAFETAQETSQSNPWIFLGLSRIALEQGDTEGAVSNAKKAVDLSPKDWEIVGWHGTVLRKTDQAEAALAQHDAAIGWAPEHAALHVERGRDLWILQRFADAQGAFDQALTLDPEVAGGAAGAAASRTAQAVALRLAEGGDQDRAKALLKEAVDRWNDPAARVNLALIALEGDDIDAANALVSGAGTDSAGGAKMAGDVAAIRAFVAVRNGRMDVAAKQTRQAQSKGTQLGRLHAITQAYLAADGGNWDKAAEAFDRAKKSEADPETRSHLEQARTFAWFQVGLERLGRGDGPGSKAALARASAGAAGFTRADKMTLRFATTALGVVAGKDPIAETVALSRLLRGRDYRGAAGRTMRETGQAYIAYGYLRGERPEDALKALSRVKTTNPAITAIRHAAEDTLAKRAFDKGRYAEAAKTWSRLSDSDPADVESTHNAAVATFMAGDLDGASKRWQSLAAGNTGGTAPAMTWYNLGVAADRRGDYKQAYDFFQRYARKPGADAEKVQTRIQSKSRVFGYTKDGGT